MSPAREATGKRTISLVVMAFKLLLVFTDIDSFRCVRHHSYRSMVNAFLHDLTRCAGMVATCQRLREAGGF
jgi:hypothetical protein